MCEMCKGTKIINSGQHEYEAVPCPKCCKQPATWMFTTEGTKLKDLLRKPTGTTGTFVVSYEHRDALMKTVGSYTNRGGGAATCKSFPVVFDGHELVQHIVFVTVEKPNRKRVARRQGRQFISTT